MQEFLDFLYFLNTQMQSRSLTRLETMLMPANFSSIVGEFMNATIPKYCGGLVKNRYHNGHPDLIPANKWENDMCQHGSEGIEIKSSQWGCLLALQRLACSFENSPCGVQPR